MDSVVTTDKVPFGFIRPERTATVMLCPRVDSSSLLTSMATLQMPTKSPLNCGTLPKIKRKCQHIGTPSESCFIKVLLHSYC